MTVQAYIARGPAGEERAFDHPFKRATALHTVKALWRAYHESASHYAVLVNLAEPLLDMVIIGNNGLALLALEGQAHPIGGRDDTEWALLDTQGKRFMLLPRRGDHLNPYDQVRMERRLTYGTLRTAAESHAGHLPGWLIDGRYELEGAILFMTARVDLSRIVIAATEVSRWFHIVWPEETAEFASELRFGGNRKSGELYRLERPHIDFLVEQVFHLSPWTEIAPLLPSRTPVGHFWILADNRELWPVPLDQDVMTVGRLPNSAIWLDSDAFSQVSREHARVRCEGKSVFLGDLGSRHGTWVNGFRLARGAEQRLESGDRIVFGPVGEDGQPVPGACSVVFRAGIVA